MYVGVIEALGDKQTPYDRNIHTWLSLQAPHPYVFPSFRCLENQLNLQGLAHQCSSEYEKPQKTNDTREPEST